MYVFYQNICTARWRHFKRMRKDQEIQLHVQMKEIASLTLLPPYEYVLYWLLTMRVRAVPAPW